MRYAIISDIHANLEAFQAVMEDAGEVSQVWCLGDVVGYGPNPNECIALLRQYRHVCIAGNHDWTAAGKLDLKEFNADAKEAIIWTIAQLDPTNLAYLQSRPLVDSATEFTVVHGSPRDPIWEYLTEGAAGAAKSNFDLFTTSYCFVGHTHVPVVFRDQPGTPNCKAIVPAEDEKVVLGDSRLIVNPGAVGQPRNGDPRASYILFDGDSMTLNYRRVSYPVEQTQAKMVAAGLSERLISRLAIGL
jgi:predicted phosphodiesterase